jgi:hypothetical protein
LHLGPALAYNLNKYGTKTMAREKAEDIMKVLRKGAKILCCFGEIDIRAHVLKQADQQNVSLENVIDKIIGNYAEFLLFLKNQGFDVFVWGPIPSQKDGSEMNPEYPRYGSETDRNIATEIFNKKLESVCKDSGIGFASIFKYLINSDYTTKGEFVADGCHLSQKAWVFAKDELEKCFSIRIKLPVSDF